MTPPRRRGVVPAVVLLSLLSLLLGGCSAFGSDSSPSGPSASTNPAGPSMSAPSPASGMAEYYHQKLDWTTCRGNDRCAQLRVPLDYAKPTGRAIGIAVLKVPTTSSSGRLGPMVINPGGPGASGLDYAAGARTTFGAALRRVYDVVGFDPRGVGESTPLECGSDQQLNALVESDPDPDTAAERRTSDGLLRDVGRSCLADSGALARHVSTVEVAKDLDVLRAALGDKKLTYFGASYGTSIGATYADLFPRRIARMVLDGAIDPASSSVEVSRVQAHGFEVALRAYVGACVDRGHCFLGSTVDQGTGRIRTFLDSVEATPLKTKSGRAVTIGDAVYGVWYPLYDKSAWPVLDRELQTAFDGDGSLLMTVADAYLHRDTRGKYLDNSLEAYYAVSCLDRDDGLPSSQVARYLPRFERASPTFGRIFAYSIAACDVWPIHSGRSPGPVRATGSPPIMVVGTTRDPATPLVWARALARQLPRGVLVTRDGDGHTGYGQGSTCVDDTIEHYLVSGTVPRQDVRCS
jgi:pimeloyl-ACP methyl ester carboxylesterase